jgi:hypothetical protein
MIGKPCKRFHSNNTTHAANGQANQQAALDSPCEQPPD